MHMTAIRMAVYAGIPMCAVLASGIRTAMTATDYAILAVTTIGAGLAALKAYSDTGAAS